MPANLLELLKDQVEPQLVALVEQLLGMGTDDARNAVQTAVAVTLASFVQVVATPNGADVLSAAAERAWRIDTDLRQARRGAPYALAQNGLQALRCLLGQSALDTLASLLGKFVGVNGRGASLLLGMVAPTTLAFLGRQDASLATEGRDLGKLLFEQRGLIMAAIPEGLSTLVGPREWLDGTAQVATAARAPGPRSEIIADGTGVAADRTTGGLSLKQAMGLLVAGVIMVGIWQLVSGTRIQDATPRQAAPASAAVTSGNVDFGSTITIGLARLDQSLSKITDVASARAALPAIRNISDSMDKVRGLAGQLPASSQTTLADMTAKATSTLRTELDRVYTIPGVVNVLKGELDPLLTTIAGFVNNPTRAQGQ